MKSATSKSADNLSALVYQRIKNDIFDFKLMPGERFTESEVAQAYEVSRTPIRQALYRLQQEGYVGQFPQWLASPTTELPLL